MSSGNYTVLARKWRPQRFDEVVGQDSVVRTLANALQRRRIAHAYCFSGIRGVGKTTAARLLAKGLNCNASEGPTAEPCGQCESCTEIEGSRSMDVIELDAASQTGVDNIRELNEVTRYAPARDRHRVFIIDEAHMLSTAAFNALLKTLEEPPPHVVFILATTEANKILPTVLSRCQHYQFGRISQGEIGGHLGKIAVAEGVDISPDALALLATAADGSLRDGQSLLDKLIAFAGEQIDEATVINLLGLVDRVLLFRATDLIADQDLPGVLGFVNEMVDQGIDLHQFAIDLLGHFRNLLVVHTVPDARGILHLPEGDLDRLRQQAEAFEVDDLDRGFSLLASNEYRIKTAEQPRYHLEIVMARLARMPRLLPVQQLLAALDGDDGSGGGSPAGGSGRRSRPAASGPSLSARRTSTAAATEPRNAPAAPDRPVTSPAVAAATAPPRTPADAAPAAHVAAPAPGQAAKVQAPAVPPPAAPPASPPERPATRPSGPEEPPLPEEPYARRANRDMGPPATVSEPRHVAPAAAGTPADGAPPAVAVAEPPAPASVVPTPQPQPVVATQTSREPEQVVAAPLTPDSEPGVVTQPTLEPGPVVATQPTAVPDPVIATQPALESEPVATATPVAGPAAAAPPTPPVADDPPVMVSRLLERIRDQVDTSHPMASSVLGRVSGLSLAGERIVFQLPATAGIFIQRLQDPEMLRLLSDAAEQVLGRRVVARVEGDPNATGPLLAPPEDPEPEPEPAATMTAEPPPAEPGDRPELNRAAEPVRARAPMPPAGTTPPSPVQPPVPAPEPAGLRERVENEPRVQEFVRALRGEITSVEEVEDRS
jgi:DNA polymerase-3 subunit gamma/tau